MRLFLKLTTSFYTVYIVYESQKYNVDNDPPYHYLNEAERLMQEEVQHNRDNLIIFGNNTVILSQILIAHQKFNEAKRVLSPCIEKLQAATSWKIA